MRDISIVAIVFSCFVISLRNPYVGFMSWEWLSLMTPHMLAFGFSQTMPVAQIAIIGTLVGLLMDRNKGKLFQHGIVILQLLFLVWVTLTTVFAIYPDSSQTGLIKFSKIMLGMFLSYPLVNSRERLNWLVWLIYFSVGFYGVKGGLFTLRSGGGDKVWGPAGSFIGDNNTLACALLMIMPLGFYLMTATKHPKIKNGLIVSMALIGVSVLGSNSRGAFLGLLAVLLFWMKNVPGKQKIIALLVTAFIAAVALIFMPQSYWDRMNTVKTYDKDDSAMGRINAWWCTYNLAMDRFTGAGFDFASPYTFKMYAPNPLDIHTAHSIYFQVLGDHGFVGLGLFLLILFWTWILLGKTIRLTKANENFIWANNLARMTQLSFIAYCTAGAFLSLPYYDLYWQLVANSVILHTLVVKIKAEASFAADPLKDITKNTKIPASFVRPCK